MTNTFFIDGEEYSVASFSDEGRSVFTQLLFSSERIRQLNAETALLMKAKNGYISDLKMEITEKKSGVNFETLFMDE
jgi:hypothetical protein